MSKRIGCYAAVASCCFITLLAFAVLCYNIERCYIVSGLVVVAELMLVGFQVDPLLLRCLFENSLDLSSVRLGNVPTVNEIS